MQLKAQDQTKPSGNYRDITHIAKTRKMSKCLYQFLE